MKHLQLGISAAAVLGAACIYGANPSKILPYFFDFEVENLELKNIFRAVMGLYIGFAIYWIVGIKSSKHWRGATISSVIFMGGLVFGRTISTILDGVSLQFGIGLILELLMMVWGLFNLKKQKQV